MMNKVEYLLVQLAEEAAKIALEADKCLRLGFKSTNESMTNERYLMGSIGDLLAVMDMLKEEGHLILPYDIDQHVTAKKKRILESMADSWALGTLEEYTTLN